MGTKSIELKKESVGDCDELGLLIEVIGARNLVLRDDDELLRGVDPSTIRPFCVVKFDGKRIHKTKPSKDLGCNPIWTPHSSKSIFLLQTTARAISRSILNISIHTKIESSLPSVLNTTTSTFLGQIHIDSTTILAHCDEERFELTIEDEFGEKLSNLGKLALRCRVATSADRTVLAGLNSESTSTSSRTLAEENRDSSSDNTKTEPRIFSTRSDRQVTGLFTERARMEVAQNSFMGSAKNLFVSNTTTCPETGQTKVRVKPYPDPDRVHQTEFLKPLDIKIETKSPSTRWIEAGSGSIGRLFVEVLACDDLPNLDSGGELTGNFTDSFCTLVFEDTCAMTDVIYDELSPRWLPWTKRAFTFNVMHPSSVLYIGVFDFDVLGHEPIGRIAVNVCNLQRETVHTLSYNLYPAANVTERKAVGSITIRLRLEWFDPRGALIAASKPRPTMHVNVEKQRTYRVVRYTCYGEYDNPEEFNTTLMRSYVNELFEYKRNMGYVMADTFRSLIFWRGQVEVLNIKLPIHSLIFFVGASRLVEKPQLIVPFSLLGGAWIMLANLTIRRQHPSPWYHRLSFLDYLSILRTGKSSTPIKLIKEFEGAEAAEAYDLAWQRRVDRDMEIALKKAELLQELSDIDVNIQTKVQKQSLIAGNIFDRLGRYQGMMSRMCKKFRFMKMVLTWEESMVSFFVTATLLSGGLVALVLPWGFILTWTGRAVVWGFLGPHMKIVDLILRANEKNQGTVDEMMKNFDIQSNRARLKREQDLKIKDMKQLAFGKYSVEVPSYNLSRHYDLPLPQSSSRVCRERTKHFGCRLKRRVSVAHIERKNPFIPGQQLYGRMIPRPEYDEKIHQFERAVAEQKMQSFKDCVDYLNALDGLSEFERRQLIKQEVTAGTPMSIGYEVVPLELTKSASTEDTDTDKEENSETFVPNPLRSVSVKLMSDKSTYVDQREAQNLVIESDGLSTYCISERCDKGEDLMEVDDLRDIPEDNDESEYMYEESPCSANIPLSFAIDNDLLRVMACNEEMQDSICSPSISATLWGPQKRKIE